MHTLKLLRIQPVACWGVTWMMVTMGASAWGQTEPRPEHSTSLIPRLNKREAGPQVRPRAVSPAATPSQAPSPSVPTQTPSSAARAGGVLPAPAVGQIPPIAREASIPQATPTTSRIRQADDRLTRAVMLADSINAPGTTAPTVPALPPVAQTSTSATKAVARFEGTPAPGLRITVSAKESKGENLHYLWVQTRGPEVRLDRADAPEVSFIIPSEATELTFHLIVAGRGGIDRAVLDVPLQLHARPALPPVVVADAGDDQVGLVGHQITLNGIRSQPRECAAYRWIQVEGHKVAQRAEVAWTCSFIPTEPGLYRFLLVVAADGVISQPDEVRVSVSSEAPSELRSGSPEQGKVQEGDRSEGRAESIEVFAHRLLVSVKSSAQSARDLAGAFDAVAERMSVYGTYAEIYAEIGRRIDTILPPETAPREDWDRLVFDPLSERIIEVLRPSGIDPSQSEDQSKALTAEQKTRLWAVFRAIAQGFRITDTPAASSPFESSGSPRAQDNRPENATLNPR